MNLIDFESKVKVLKVLFIKRLLDDSPGKWKKLANHFYNTKDFYFKCNHKENHKIEHQFYTEVHNYWSELQRVKEIDSLLVSNQVIWNNRYIMIENKPFVWRNWAGCEIVYVHDVLDQIGGFLSHTEIRLVQLWRSARHSRLPHGREQQSIELPPLPAGRMCSLVKADIVNCDYQPFVLLISYNSDAIIKSL